MLDFGDFPLPQGAVIQEFVGQAAGGVLQQFNYTLPRGKNFVYIFGVAPGSGGGGGFSGASGTGACGGGGGCGGVGGSFLLPRAVTPDAIWIRIGVPGLGGAPGTVGGSASNSGIGHNASSATTILTLNGGGGGGAGTAATPGNGAGIGGWFQGALAYGCYVNSGGDGGKTGGALGAAGNAGNPHYYAGNPQAQGLGGTGGGSASAANVDGDGGAINAITAAGQSYIPAIPGGIAPGGNGQTPPHFKQMRMPSFFLGGTGGASNALGTGGNGGNGAVGGGGGGGGGGVTGGSGGNGGPGYFCIMSW